MSKIKTFNLMTKVTKYIVFAAITALIAVGAVALFAPRQTLADAGFTPKPLDANQDCSVVTRGWLCTPASSAESGQSGTGLYVVIKNISNYVIALFGSIAVVLILWYIVTIIASGGSTDQVANAKKHLSLVAISLGLLVCAYAIIQLIGIFPI